MYSFFYFLFVFHKITRLTLTNRNNFNEDQKTRKQRNGEPTTHHLPHFFITRITVNNSLTLSTVTSTNWHQFLFGANWPPKKHNIPKNSLPF